MLTQPTDNQTCGARYERPGGAEPGDRIVKCLLLGHFGGIHRELEMSHWLATDPEPPIARVADLPCPKCGHTDVSLSYERVCHGWSKCPHWGGQQEHFHRSCRRCSYRWATDDVLGGAS
jgi:hypothetical protein